MEIILYGRPITKKNSMRICRNGNRTFLRPSKQYEEYEKICLKQLTGEHSKGINKPVNVRAIYYMPTRHRVDLVNLLEATCDILTTAGVIEDDNSKIVKAHDGSRVLYDKQNPRVEIYITEMQEE